MAPFDFPTIDYQDIGTGSPILFVPGSFSTPMAWRAIQKRLPQTFRFVSTSILGYGNTVETRSREDHAMAHEIRVIGEVSKRIGEPVHLVGHSFGGAIAFAAALDGIAEVRSICTFEGNPIHLLAEGRSRPLYHDALSIRSALEAAFTAGDPDAAGLIIDYWGGAGSFAAMPDAVKDYCKATTFANVLDWRTAFTFTASSADYGRLDLPILLVRGALANPAMIEITNTLSNALPNAGGHVVDGASHFLITSHPDDCARALSDFLSEIEA